MAEKLLQQTAAKGHVVMAYQELIRRWPSGEALAEAPLKNLQDLLAPLGLRNRPQELKMLAREII